jgi:hypothetical protein
MKNSVVGVGLQDNFPNTSYDQSNEPFYSQPRAYYTQ